MPGSLGSDLICFCFIYCYAFTVHRVDPSPVSNPHQSAMSKASKPKAKHAAKKRKSEPVPAAAVPAAAMDSSSSTPAAKDHVWITATGLHTPVKDMPTGHIQNCINCLLGGGQLTIPAGYLGGKKMWLDIFGAELQARLEQARSSRYSDGEGDYISDSSDSSSDSDDEDKPVTKEQKHKSSKPDMSKTKRQASVEASARIKAAFEDSSRRREEAAARELQAKSPAAIAERQREDALWDEMFAARDAAAAERASAQKKPK
jgi:hypothetical protein